MRILVLTLLVLAASARARTLPTVSAVPRPLAKAPAERFLNPTEDEVGVPYWLDPRIHNFGNVGTLGGLHAAVAPLFTHLIDRIAYDGVDARKRIHSVINPDHSVVDLCCGVGFSTFPGALGVDASPEMLGMAKLRRRDANFLKGNAETFGGDASFDVATIMFGMHEMPQYARRRVLRNAARIARKQVIVVDIDPVYEPSWSMLSGEPYVLDYLENIDEDVSQCAVTRAWRRARVNVIPEHVVMWRLDL